MANSTSGAAVAQTIQEILARRRAEEQQTLVNRMQQQELDEEKAAREEQNRIAREQIANQKAMTDAQIAGIQDEIYRNTIARMRPGKAPEDQALRERMQAEGLLEEVPVVGPTPDGGVLAPELMYRGSYEEQERERQKRIFEDAAAIASMPAGPEKDAALQELAIRGAGEGMPQFVSEIFRKPTVGYDPNTGKFIQPPVGQDVSFTVPWIPRPYASASERPRIYNIYDQNDQLVNQLVGVTQEELAEYMKSNPGQKAVDSLSRQPEPKVPTAVASRDIARARAAMVQANLAAEPGFFFDASNASKDAATTATAYYDSLIRPYIERYSGPPHVKALARRILTDPVISKTGQVNLRELSPNITPEDARAVQELIQMIEGPAGQVPVANPTPAVPVVGS
ncbi:MAG: hypothetical protein AB7J46_06445 [Candidatus Altimarinota bacterium]